VCSTVRALCWNFCFFGSFVLGSNGPDVVWVGFVLRMEKVEVVSLCWRWAGMLRASFAEFLVKMFFVRVSMVGQYLHVNT
jgi:hypothetical protein